MRSHRKTECEPWVFLLQMNELWWVTFTAELRLSARAALQGHVSHGVFSVPPGELSLFPAVGDRQDEHAFGQGTGNGTKRSPATFPTAGHVQLVFILRLARGANAPPQGVRPPAASCGADPMSWAFCGRSCSVGKEGRVRVRVRRGGQTAAKIVK